MIIVPVVLIIPFVLILSEYPNLNDTLVLIIIFAALAVIILLTLYVVFKQAHVPVEVSINASEIEFRFKRKTLFNWETKKNIALKQIQFFTDDEDVMHSNRRFFTIQLKNEWGKIILLSAKHAKPEDVGTFAEELSTAIQKYNSQNETQGFAITEGSFYNSNFSKLLTYCLIAVIIIATVVKIFDSTKIDWYRISWMYVLAGAWFANIYVGEKKANAKRKN